MISQPSEPEALAVKETPEESAVAQVLSKLDADLAMMPPERRLSLACDNRVIANDKASIRRKIKQLSSLLLICERLILSIDNEKVDIRELLEISESEPPDLSLPPKQPQPEPPLQPEETIPVPSPDSHSVEVVSVYQGTYESSDSHSFCHSSRGTVAVKVVDLRAEVLVLNSYEPVDWKLSVAKEASLKRVILTGYNPHKVLGLPKNIKVEHRTYYSYARTLSSAGPQAAFVSRKDPQGMIYHWAGHEMCKSLSGAIPAADRRELVGSGAYIFLSHEASAENDAAMLKLLGTKNFRMQGAYEGKGFTVD